MWTRRVLLAAVVGSSILLASRPAANADCAGPQVEYPAGEVGRGEALTITGTGFGDNCYDTGPPPAGQDVLGRPLQDIEVLFVQGETEIVVARGHADEEYGFDVDVAVPADLDAGEARIVARYNDHGQELETYVDHLDPVVVTAAPPVEPTTGPEAVVTFGRPIDRASAEPASDNEAGSSDESSRLVPGLLVLGVLAVAGTIVWRRRSGGAVVENEVEQGL